MMIIGRGSQDEEGKDEDEEGEDVVRVSVLHQSQHAESGQRNIGKENGVQDGFPFLQSECHTQHAATVVFVLYVRLFVICAIVPSTGADMLLDEKILVPYNNSQTYVQYIEIHITY